MIYNTPKEILSEIRRIMMLNDIEMKELAIRMHTTPQNIGKIFKTANPQSKKIFEICNALNLNIDVTFTSKGDTD